MSSKSIKTTPSTALQLPPVIAKLALRSTAEQFEDGTVTFTFKGEISALDAHAAYVVAMMHRDTKTMIVSSATAKEMDWSVKQKYKTVKGGKFQVVFVLNDYTEAIKREKAAKK